MGLPSCEEKKKCNIALEFGYKKVTFGHFSV